MKTNLHHSLQNTSALFLIASTVAGALAFTNQAQAATDVWNNSTTLWETINAWTPAGPPTATDIASFDPTVAGTVVNNPTITATTDVAAALNLNNNFLGGTYGFSGTGTLTLGSGGVTVRGFGTQTISGPILAGAAAGNLTFNVGTSAGLTLAGATTATTNSGQVTANGGTFTVDNSTSTVAKLSGNAVTVNGGGTFAYVGNTTATTLSLGQLNTPNNGLGGTNVISVTPNGARATVNFSNATGTTLRAGTRTTFDFQATSGNLGAANGAQVTFTTTPFLGSGNLFANTAGGGTVGFATVTDALGKNFATYANTADTVAGVVSVANPNQTRVTVTTVTSPATLTSATLVAQYNAPTGTTSTANTAVTAATLRITPAGAGAVLDPGTANVAVAGLMLDGANNYSITSSAATPGVIGTGTHYYYVNNPATTLSTNLQFTNSTNATVFAGPGTVALTGTALQNGGTSANNYRISITGGVLRGNNTQIEFTTAATRGVIDLFGGVLEITNGANGTGTAADFTRALGTNGGNVAWTGTAGQDQGSGGFSAFGAAASVNIGGAATPATLTWATTANFVNDGYALRFGSTQSNAVLTFQNPIALDGGTAGTYAAREINVTRNTTANSGDRTVLSGALTGSNTTDLIKTGTGRLDLTGANTYAGRTFVQGGTLFVGNTTGSGTGTGAVTVNNSGTLLTGTGTISGAVTVNALARITGGTDGTVGTLKTGALTLASTAILLADISSTSSADLIDVTGTVNVTGATLTLSVANGLTFTAGQQLTLISNDGTDAFTGTFASLAEGGTINSGGYSFTVSYLGTNGVGNDLVLTAVPEPATWLGGGLILGLAGWSQRKRLGTLLAG